MTVPRFFHSPSATRHLVLGRNNTGRAGWLGGIAFLLLAFFVHPASASANSATIRLQPSSIFLASPGQTQHYLIEATDAAGNTTTVTDQATVTSLTPEVVGVDNAGNRLIGKQPGTGRVRVTHGAASETVTVRVGKKPAGLSVSFVKDVISILTTKGCNGSGCHGSPAGQAGFKLSLFGDDPAADHEMIVHEHDGRRVNLDEPEQSLILAKPSFQIAHGGGRVLPEDSEEYETILKWLQQGAPLGAEGVRLTRLELYPRVRVLAGTDSSEQLVAIARLSDGTTRDMTKEVRYQVGDENVAEVNEAGKLLPRELGMTNVVARAMGAVATSQISVIENIAGPDYPGLETDNFIDELVFAKLRQVNVRPAALTSDREFIRRVYLDLLGLLPEPERVRGFVEDQRKGKRSRLIDELLESPEYAAYWTVRFEDWLRNCQLHMQGRSMGTFKDWIREWLAADRPYDEVVREMLTSQGDSMRNPAVNFWHPSADFMEKTFSVNKVTPTVTRLFMGVRMECAECHNHPLENFTQDDFYGMAAFFADLRVKHGVGAYRRIWYLEEGREVEHPVTNEPVVPKFLGGEKPEIPPGTDRRRVLAEWITSPRNPLFAQATVNRFWHHYFTVGIVEPFDDFRSTNMPSNPELLERLAEYFRDSGYSLKALHRLILNSRTYQLRSQPGEPSQLEKLLFARYLPRKLHAEVLLDIVAQVTGVPHDFDGYAEGTRARDLYIPDRPDYFLVTFGFPRRDALTARSQAPTLGQALHLLNGDSVREKVESPGGVLVKMLERGFGDNEILTTLYERAYARPPKTQEVELASSFIASEMARGRSRQRAWENLFWAILNSKEFQLNH